MWKANRNITIVLAVVAAALWVLSVVSAYGYMADRYRWLAIAVSLGACLGWTLTTVSHRRERETRCRKCMYILRGISEPRCPECGEPI